MAVAEGPSDEQRGRPVLRQKLCNESSRHAATRTRRGSPLRGDTEEATAAPALLALGLTEEGVYFVRNEREAGSQCCSISLRTPQGDYLSANRYRVPAREPARRSQGRPQCHGKD